MFRKFSLYFLLLGLLLVPIGCSGGQSTDAGNDGADAPAENIELMISAAASLTDALNEIKSVFESEHPGSTLTINPGSSGKLATQIEQGAPSDVFLSASKKDMDRLEEQGLIDKDTRVDFTNNVLVLITNKENPSNLSSFEEIDPAMIGDFAIGEPESVPAGRYTKEVFEHLNLWEPMQDKLVLASDVRQVLTYVESGNAELGVVYSSDASISDKVTIIAESNPEWHAPIVYPGAVLADTSHDELAKAFLDYLTSDAGKEVLNKYGFK
ncbi:molybdate ABC transporter substrate-binding protein [Ammoniphilus oxalaticus]|uniref:Molybdate ABC transporter substrate-binding protein n=1 Tax=Ammoniphilus oxalaticus TaxID=66863 RepID=A0A419SLT3_9BACL|nr:molybdate ABC transporter substrate-binding protein [Ammoniphilus oxalaticus]RKD25018.1 molybdate ABC transporter substrate-binding protein [Ammoniphilus oxalaticus]